MSLTDERKELEKNKDNLKAARTAINNKFIELGGTASTSFNDVPEKTAELAKAITDTNKTYIDNKTGDLNNLQTKNKDNLVNAINEVKNSSGSVFGLIFDSKSEKTGNGKIEADNLTDNGNAIKDNLVNAINEVKNSSGSVFGLIFDSKSEKTGNGKIEADNLTDNGNAIVLSGNTTNLISYFKTDKIKLGRYGITIRVKTSNNTLSKNILKIEIVKVANNSNETSIKTINFTGTDFKAANQYCWLTSYFDYSLAKTTGDKLGIKVSIGDSIGTNVSLSLDYIAISPLMSAQYVIG